MIEREGIGFHNVVAFEPHVSGGHYLRRFPRDVREAMGILGRMVSQESCGAEIRFVTDSPSFRLTLATEPSVLAPYERHNQDVFVFRGPFLHAHHRLTPGQTNFIDVINFGGPDRLVELKPEARRGCGFDGKVWRVLIGRFPAIFLGLDTFGVPHRAPTAEEVPTARWLAYGSSITAGAGATTHHNAYIYHAARGAAVDVFNQGLSGSCLCEPRVASYLAERDDWDLITLEIGVNMRMGYTPEEFRQRAEALIEGIRSHHPRKPIALISIYPNSASAQYAIGGSESGARQEAFADILRQLASSARWSNVSLIEGSDVLDQFESLTSDLIHPSDYGHARMGAYLAPRLKELRREG